MPTKEIKAECPECSGTKHCSILFETENSWSSDDGQLDGWDRHEVLQCGGCKTIFFRHLSKFSEDWDPETGPLLRCTYYPAIEIVSRIERFNYFSAMGKKGWGLSQEIYKAINGDIPRLAAMGIRSLIELLAEQLAGKKHDTFAESMASFVDGGWISTMQMKILDAALELGHGTIHRGHAPKMDEVQSALDIVESIIELVIVNKKKADELNESVPPRPPRVKKPKVPAIAAALVSPPRAKQAKAPAKATAVTVKE